ncbi:MAG: site-specific DNA-methyltransferase [Candidatus Izemoplasmatales bacterium]
MAEKLEMLSSNIIQENIDYIASKFPNALKEVKENGKLVKKIDFDVLKQELSTVVIDDKQERYQMTWPDKKKSILLANSRINATLRPVKEKSVDFDNTQNLYIEGDNLDVLKLLRETYLEQVDFIYIDPPYNTGTDFIYEDDFSQSVDEYQNKSGLYDEQGNRLFINNDSNGRFHTDWLNMMYTRLKIAKDLLKKDGVIFMSINDIELVNLCKVGDEIFGASNHLANLIVISAPAGTQSSVDFATQQSYCVVYRKSSEFKVSTIPLNKVELKSKYSYGNDEKGNYYIERIWKRGAGGRKEDVPSLHFPVWFNEKTREIYIDNEVEKLDKNTLIKIIPYQTTGVLGRWTWSREKMIKERENLIVVKVADEWKLHKKMYDLEDSGKVPYTIIDSKLGRTELGSLEIKEIFGDKVFDYPKYSELIKHFIRMHKNKSAVVMDFFSGSASTAHAVMQLNSEEIDSHRKFIMVQLPEMCPVNSDAYKAGYKTICEIGQERIRRSGKKIKEDAGVLGQNLDIGFRVLKLDSSNMNDVYYNPNSITQDLLGTTVDNIKVDRTPLDLLFQTMLELGIELSAKIEEKELLGKKYFVVNENDIVACFDDGINDELVKELAKVHSIYAVFKDSAFASDSSNINCEQIFKSISPTTTIKVI